jgi:membrane-bound lytic murein transglycosylase B
MDDDMFNKAFVVSSITASLFVSPTAQGTVFSERPEVKQFLKELEAEPKLNTKQILSALSQIESSEEIIKKISTPYEALPWDKYQKLFIGQERINDGVKFWNKNKTTLEQAETKFGVPAEIIVAIIGVESSYGKNRGKYPVLQALATLAFDYPPRAKFFRTELKEYLLLTAEHNLDPLELKGSYAGAMGSPQFISSSYRNYAVDFDNSGQIDLINNIQQAIGSVGNYFKVHGWKAGQPVAFKATTKGSKYQALPVAAKNDPKPVLSLATIKEHGVVTKEKMPSSDAHVAWLEFENGTNKEYWLGLNNFYVITRYNHSNNYAMAVYQLSQAIATLYNQQSTTKAND